MRRRISIFHRLAVLLLLLRCGDVRAATQVFAGNQTGANENPANASPATGTVMVTWDDVALTMRIQGSFSGLTANATGAHIHCCVAPPMNIGIATPAPAFTGFPLNVTSGTYDHTFNMVDAASYNSSFVTNNGGVVGAMNALATGLANGMAYLNIHTTNFPGGEIRAFLLCSDMGTAPAVTAPSAITLTQTLCQ